MQIGTVLSLPGAVLAELAGSALDFAWIDLEHGALGLGDVQAMAVGLAAAGCPAHVRLPSARAELLPAVIDAGIDGVVAPRVESAEIAGVDGIDSVVVGCSDLSLELDVPQDLGSEPLRDAVVTVAGAASAAGARFGLAASGDPAGVLALAAGRADLVVYSADSRMYSVAIDAAVRSLEEPSAAV